jgi:hypothetical protein
MLDHQALAGLHTDRYSRAQRGDLLAPALPARRTVLDFKIGNNLATPIQDDDITVIVRPSPSRHNESFHSTVSFLAFGLMNFAPLRASCRWSS